MIGRRRGKCDELEKMGLVLCATATVRTWRWQQWWPFNSGGFPPPFSRMIRESLRKREREEEGNK
ncbi:hypothetical protein TIFTF001_037724 [Ficus carica]|uniref:Uncharacterized protein n=1 Tax=Ficus carica TaxID=3494 RepID=A0AA88JDV9_FICCA|nr:hypothetical protein TIFTF001_037720 [Ficus carica]GMN68668.1 hypothetical protein TIFTF001_037724 [Ficus carica]